MKSSPATFPLGVDIGQRRVRVALTARAGDGSPRLLAVAGHDHDGDPAEALRWAIEDLQTQERRCILAMAPPDALLCTAEFPAMSPWERVSAARFEAARFIDYPIADAAVSLVRTNTLQRWTIGVVRRAALAAALGVAKRAQLRPLAVDDMAFALRRSHPDTDGIIDVGNEATRLTIFGETIPYVMRLPIGGAAMTDAIAQSLGIDAATAEERKRSVGFGGAGDAPRDALITALAEALADARASGGHAAIRSIVLCGNGSRIPGFGPAIERATGYAVVSAALPPDCSETIPPDVLRAAAADWSVAYGLSLWNAAS
jgi:Tfp pilus assembly PilM family ATPase